MARHKLTKKITSPKEWLEYLLDTLANIICHCNSTCSWGYSEAWSKERKMET